MVSFHSRMKLKFEELSEPEKRIINEVWDHRTEFVQWPTMAILLWDGCVRVRYHHYPEEIKNKLRSKRIRIDSRSNGPAVMSFLFAGGRRPKRTSDPQQEWHIHHIYDGRFPWIDNRDTLHAVQSGKHFTQSAGLVAIHPIAEALADEYFYFAWLLRYESYLKFSYDPDTVFRGKTDNHGFQT